MTDGQKSKAEEPLTSLLFNNILCYLQSVIIGGPTFLLTRFNDPRLQRQTILLQIGLYF